MKLIGYQILTFVTIFFFAGTRESLADDLFDSNWASLPKILEQINAPEFPDSDFNITEFGAKPGKEIDSLPAISKAIAQCNQSGGGKVVVPPGEWFAKGPIHLKSNVNLHISEGATIFFSNDPQDFLPVVFTRFEGTEVMSYSPLIYAFEQENIAITGKGTVDGQAANGKWWNWKGRWGGGATKTGWKDGDPNQASSIEILAKMVDDNVPPEKRIFGEGHFLRSSFVQPYRCKNVLIEGITIHRSPMWIIHPVLSTNVTVRGATVDSHGPNNDGCNPESCKNVLIEECFFNTGDDCIAIKSGRNADGRRIGVPSENIVVRNCTMRDGHGGVVMGSEMSGGVKNVFVENCKMDSPHLERAIRLKSNSLRGGYLENMFVRNLEVGVVSDAVFRINLEYWGESGDFLPSVRNVFIEDVKSKKSKYPMYLVGLPEYPIKNLHIRNCEFENASKPSIIEHVNDLTLENVSQPR